MIGTRRARFSGPMTTQLSIPVGPRVSPTTVAIGATSIALSPTMVESNGGMTINVHEPLDTFVNLSS